MTIFGLVCSLFERFERLNRSWISIRARWCGCRRVLVARVQNCQFITNLLCFLYSFYGSTQFFPSLIIIQMQSKEIKSHGFLMKTFNMLESGEHKDIIDWSADGKGFLIRDLKGLEAEHSNFQSFVRQLNMYGFHKIRSSKDSNYYSHQLFCREDRQKIKIINRKAQKKMAKRCHTPEKNQKQSSVYMDSLASLLKVNMSLLEEQHFLAQTLKDSWHQIQKQLNASRHLPIQGGNGYKVQQQRAERSLDSYWTTQQQMLSKLYMESLVVMNNEEAMLDTHTSLTKI